MVVIAAAIVAGFLMMAYIVRLVDPHRFSTTTTTRAFGTTNTTAADTRWCCWCCFALIHVFLSDCGAMDQRPSVVVVLVASAVDR